MPRTTLNFKSEAEIPASLRASATKVSDDNYTVEVFYGGEETVAKETNVALAANRDTILQEKNTLETKYNSLLQTSAETATKFQELQIKVATGQKVPQEDLNLLNEIKTLGTLDEIKTKVTNFETTAQERDRLKQEKLHSEVFDALGYTNRPETRQIFMDLISNPAKMTGVSDIFFQDVKEGEKTVKRPHVKIKDAAGVESNKLFTEYVKENSGWQPYLGQLSTTNTGSPWFNQTTTDNNNNDPNNQNGSLLSNIVKAQNAIVEKQPDPFKPSGSGQSMIGQGVNQN